MDPEIQRCPKCGYEWNSKGRLLFVQCPNCRRFFHREEKKPKKKVVF